MFYKIKSTIKVFFLDDDSRTKNAKKHIFGSFIFKGLNSLFAFLIVPVALTYLNQKTYGVWLTISSITGYLIFFNVGLESGLRTKFAEAIADNKIDLAKKYVSTTYALVAILVFVFVLILIVVNPLLNWAVILNADLELASELNILVLIVIVSFLFRFIFQIIGTILLADQRPAIKELILAICQAVVLISIYILSKYSESSLIKFGIIYSGTPILIFLIASLYLFNTKYKIVAPNIRFVDLQYYKSLMTLGGKFFVVQIGVVILFSTDSLIISHIFDPSYVTTYQISHKYFFTVIMAYSIVVSPYWSAFTEAYIKQEMRWIKKSMKGLIKVWMVFLFITIFMFFVSDKVYQIWVGDSVSISKNLSLGMAHFVLIRTLNSPFTSFLNGIGKVKLQMLISLIIALVNIPLSIYLAKNLQMGTVGVIVSTSICLLISLIFYVIQTYKIIKGRAAGIWDQ